MRRCMHANYRAAAPRVSMPGVAPAPRSKTVDRDGGTDRQGAAARCIFEPLLPGWFASGSHVTLRWREEDSNRRSLSKRVASPTEREMPRERKGESRQRQLSFGAPNVRTRLPPPARLTRVTEHSLRRLLKDFELFGFAVQNSKSSPYSVL
jgi:hypothetical protein